MIFQNHILTPSQAKCLAAPELGWEVVRVQIGRYKSDRTPIAEHVNYKESYLGRAVSLTFADEEEQAEWLRLTLGMHERMLEELRNEYVFAVFDDAPPEVAVLMKDETKDVWLAGNKPCDSFRTSQVAGIGSLEGDPYQTICIRSVAGEVE